MSVHVRLTHPHFLLVPPDVASRRPGQCVMSVHVCLTRPHLLLVPPV